MKKILLLLALFAFLTLALPFSVLLLPKIDNKSASSAPSKVASSQIASAPDFANGDNFLILNEADGTVMTVSEKDFVMGAIAAEMPISWPDEALKAQGVAAHSYALARKALASPDDIALKGAHFSANPSRKEGFLTLEVQKLVWGKDFDKNHARLESIASSIFSDIVMYEDKPALTCYCAISNGVTEASDSLWTTALPYLVSVDSTLDLTSPDYEKSTEVSRLEFKEAMAMNFAGINLSQDAAAWIGESVKSEAGYIKEISVGGVKISGADLRKALKLRSASFTCSYANDVFTFVTHGYGHGVGMSQYGACAMARTGKTYKEILAHYYPTTVIKNIKL
ncbi:MAG: stage II sporulation protein D [Oscillospiraceae bacterium]